MSNINNNPTIGVAQIYPMPNPTPINNPNINYAPVSNVQTGSMSLHKPLIYNPANHYTIGDIFNVEIGRKYWAVINCNYLMECDIVHGDNITCNQNKTYATIGIDTTFIANMIDIFDSRESASRKYRDLYRRGVRNDTTIGSQYLVSIGMKCWAVIGDIYYECTIIEGSDVDFSKDGRSVTIGIDSSSNCCGMYFNLYHYENEEFARNAASEWADELGYIID